MGLLHSSLLSAVLSRVIRKCHSPHHILDSELRCYSFLLLRRNVSAQHIDRCRSPDLYTFVHFKVDFEVLLPVLDRETTEFAEILLWYILNMEMKV